MRTVKSVAVCCAALLLTSVSAFAEEYVEKNIAHTSGDVMPSIAISVDNPMSISGCTGVCSAKPGVNMRARWMKSAWFEQPDNSFELHTSAGISYSSLPLTVNGNASNFDSEAINLGFHIRHRELPKLEFSLNADVFGMSTLRSDAAPRQVDFASAGGMSLSYAVTPAFQISLGLENHSIPSASTKQINLNTVNLGFTWTPKRK